MQGRGAAMGYARAGFRVIGVDIEPQPNFPFEFYQDDAFSVVRQVMDGTWKPAAIHASMPCKRHTVLYRLARHNGGREHPDLVTPMLDLLEALGLPYVMENVPGAPLPGAEVICGSSFGLGVRRHRLIATNWCYRPPPCDHQAQDAASPLYPVKRYHSGSAVVTMSPVVGVYGRGQGLGPGEVDLWRQAMGIDWMTREELSQAIPPAYTEHIGRELMGVASSE
jgi:DNA (cytosine-5)-methyltransferase 1